MEEVRKGRKTGVSKQGTLDSLITKSGLVGPQAFTRENLLHVVTQFVTVDDQVRLTVKMCRIYLTGPPVACSYEQSDVPKLFGCDAAKINVI